MAKAIQFKLRGNQRNQFDSFISEMISLGYSNNFGSSKSESTLWSEKTEEEIKKDFVSIVSKYNLLSEEPWKVIDYDPKFNTFGSTIQFKLQTR